MDLEEAKKAREKAALLEKKREGKDLQKCNTPTFRPAGLPGCSRSGMFPLPLAGNTPCVLTLNSGLLSLDVRLEWCFMLW